MEQEIIAAIANYGFPIAISWFLLSRMEAKLDRLSSQIENLAHTLDSLLR